MKPYPTDIESYWRICAENWDNVKAIVDMFLGPKEAEMAEVMRQNQDPDIVKVFNDAWAAAPDNRSIHSIPGWSVLCDLCSESYVFDDSTD